MTTAFAAWFFSAVGYSISTSLLVFFLAYTYLSGVVILVRGDLWMEAWIAFGLPIVCMLFRLDRHYTDPRIKELFFIESIYNLMVFISLIAISMGSSSLNVVGQWGFFVFMLIQLLGFLRQVYLQGSAHGFAQTLMGITVLLLWWWGIEDRTSVVDAEGRFLMWGEDTALTFQIVYVFWSINLVFGISDFLPKLVQSMVQMASLTLALQSGEFFHVRMLTASHLFFLDGLFGHYGMNVVNTNFCSVPEAWRSAYMERVRPIVHWVTTVGVTITFLYALRSAIVGG